MGARSRAISAAVPATRRSSDAVLDAAAGCAPTRPPGGAEEHPPWNYQTRASSPASATMPSSHVVGTLAQRVDTPRPCPGPDRLLRGPALFPGMLHLKMVRSPHHHARIQQRRHRPGPDRPPGVVRVLTAPGRAEQLVHDPAPDRASARATSRCCRRTGCSTRGEQVVAVLADSRKRRRRPRRPAKVKVAYERLPAVFDVEEALKPGAPAAIEAAWHQLPRLRERPSLPARALRRCRQGASPGPTTSWRRRYQYVADRACADRDHRLHRRARGQWPPHHPFQHPGLVFTLDNAALILDVPFGKLRVVGGTVGGGFGGKVDVMVEPIAVHRARC